MIKQEQEQMEHELRLMAGKIGIYTDRIMSNMWTIKDTVEAAEAAKRAAALSIAANLIMDELPYVQSRPYNAE